MAAPGTDLTPTTEVLKAEAAEAHPTATSQTLDFTSLLNPTELGSKLRDVTDQVSSTVDATVDQALTIASDRLRYGASVASTEASRAVSTAQDYIDEGLNYVDRVQHDTWKIIEEQATPLREYPRESLAVGSVLALALVPSFRSAAWGAVRRLTMSEAARLKSAERAAASVKEVGIEQTNELKKLTERLALAEAEWARGKSKMEGTASELDALASRIRKSQAQADALVAELRRLGSRDAVARRAEVAEVAAQTRTQGSAVGKLLKRLASKGF